jgi:hypothetical protein
MASLPPGPWRFIHETPGDEFNRKSELAAGRAGEMFHTCRTVNVKKEKAMWCGQFFVTAIIAYFFGSAKDNDNDGDCGNGAYVSWCARRLAGKAKQTLVFFALLTRKLYDKYCWKNYDK